MKEMVHRQKVNQCNRITFSIKHPVFPQLVLHSEWILNHLVHNDFLVEDVNRVMKTLHYESHTGNPAPRSTQLLNPILVSRREDDDKQPRFQKHGFWVLLETRGW